MFQNIIQWQQHQCTMRSTVIWWSYLPKIILATMIVVCQNYSVNTQMICYLKNSCPLCRSLTQFQKCSMEISVELTFTFLMLIRIFMFAFAIALTHKKYIKERSSRCLCFYTHIPKPEGQPILTTENTFQNASFSLLYTTTFQCRCYGVKDFEKINFWL